MKIYNLPQTLKTLEDKILFLDNTALVLFYTFSSDFSDVLYNLKQAHCALLTIPSVAFEFQRTDTIENFNKRTEFLDYFEIYPVERHLDI